MNKDGLSFGACEDPEKTKALVPIRHSSFRSG
jgi:hypothetical protein